MIGLRKGWHVLTVFEWNHNTHYHKQLLRQLPKSHESVLDIGSGLGLFSFKISSIFKDVFSLELDQESIEYARKQYGTMKNVIYVHDSFLEYDFRDQKFDCIAAIASIHHMDFDGALEKMTMLLNPGGRILILGLYKESSVADFFISFIAIFPNFILNLLSKKKGEGHCEMVTTHPVMTIKDIKTASKRILNKFRFKRHLFWRYSLIYDADRLL